MSPLRLPPLTAPAALVLAGAAVARWQVDEGAPATLFLALAGALVLAPLAATEPPRERIVPVASVALFAALVALPRTSPLPTATILFLLVATLGFAAAARAARPRAARAAWFGLAFAAQAAAQLDRVWLAPMAPTTLALLLVPPGVVAWVLLDWAATRPAGALAAGAASFACGPGWDGWSAGALLLAWGLGRTPIGRRPRVGCVLMVAAAAVPAARREPLWLVVALAAALALAAGGPTAPWRRRCAGGLVVAALAGLLAGALPWRREPPLARALAALAQRPFGVALDAGSAAVLLTKRQPALERTATVERAIALRVDSWLNQAVDLPCGTPVATLTGWSGGREVVRSELLVGRDTAEWAAERSDVASRLACRPPRPNLWWMPASGRYFGVTYSTRRSLPRPMRIDQVRVERRPDLPADVQLAIFALQVER